MKKITRCYPNGFKRVFSVVNAQWANDEKTAAVMFTEESGAVLTGKEQPEIWHQLMEGVEIIPAPEPPKPSDEEYAEMLLKKEALERVKKMTDQEKAGLLK